MIALALWYDSRQSTKTSFNFSYNRGLELEPGKKFSMVVERDFRLQLATLGDELVDDKRSSVIVHQIVTAQPDNEDDEDESDGEDEDESKSSRRKMVVANLIPGKVRSIFLSHHTFSEGDFFFTSDRVATN
jgi:hypothetical protein